MIYLGVQFFDLNNGNNPGKAPERNIFVPGVEKAMDLQDLNVQMREANLGKLPVGIMDETGNLRSAVARIADMRVGVEIHYRGKSGRERA